MDFKESFCWHFSVSNDDIISQRPGLKTEPGLKAVVDIFWFEIGLGFEEPDGAPKPRTPSSFPWGQPW